MIQVGPSPVTISELGRWKLSGNSRWNTVKIVQQNNMDLPEAWVTVNMANGAVGTFVYAALPAPITLAANTSYYLVTSVTMQGDTWYDLNQKVTSTGGVSVGPTVWAPEVGGYSLYGAGGTSFGPVGLKGGSGAQIGVTTTVATYEYDDENQLTSITLGTQSRTIFRYDGKRRRRVTREETMGSSGNWVLASETRYVYDGMRVIQERNGNGIPTVAYTRGPDLSGTLEGAGGIGGLLARSEWDGGSWSQHAFYHSDGVGNVTALAVPSGGGIALAGSYRYDPFGRLIGTPTGLAARNTQRFSSKEWHNPSGFYYFGYRFYDPATQRWLNRDPIGEEGGINLYGYVRNDPIRYVDRDGRIPVDTVWDVGSMIYDVGKIGVGYVTGNPALVTEGSTDLAADAAATLVPYVPAGGSKLARALGKAGKLKKGEHAHHCVAKAAKKAEEAREKLKQLGIDPDDIDNGVGLPPSFHQGMHTDEYYDMVNQASRGWNTPEQARQGLQEIANGLSQQAR
jgi:RHS repeat-associated protein